MKINGYELNLTEEKLDEMLERGLRPVELITPEFEGWKKLPENEKKAVKHLVKAAEIMNDVSLEQDHPLNLQLKKDLKKPLKTVRMRQKRCVCSTVLTV